jgi:hypothetical protein
MEHFILIVASVALIIWLGHRFLVWRETRRVLKGVEEIRNLIQKQARDAIEEYRLREAYSNAGYSSEETDELLKAIKDRDNGVVSKKRKRQIMAAVDIRKSKREATQPVGNAKEADEVFTRGLAAVSKALKLGE